MALLGDSSYAFYKNPNKFVEKHVAQHGAIFKARILNKSTVFVTSHAIVEEMLTGPDAREFSLPRGYDQFMSEIYGENVMLSTEETHARLRTLL